MHYISSSSCILFSPSVSPSSTSSYLLLAVCFRFPFPALPSQLTTKWQTIHSSHPPWKAPPPRWVAQLGHLISIFSLWWEIGSNCPDCHYNCTQICAHLCTQTSLEHSHTGRRDNWDILTQNTRTMTHIHVLTCNPTCTGEWGHTKWEMRVTMSITWRRHEERLHSAGQWDTLMQKATTTP